MSDDELFFIQLPSALPISLQSRDVKKETKIKDTKRQIDDEEENIWTSQFTNTLTKLPPGFIGQMYVYKSGKTKLKLGDVLYDVRNIFFCIQTFLGIARNKFKLFRTCCSYKSRSSTMSHSWKCCKKNFMCSQC